MTREMFSSAMLMKICIRKNQSIDDPDRYCYEHYESVFSWSYSVYSGFEIASVVSDDLTMTWWGCWRRGRDSKCPIFLSSHISACYVVSLCTLDTYNKILLSLSVTGCHWVSFQNVPFLSRGTRLFS